MTTSIIINWGLSGSVRRASTHRPWKDGCEFKPHQLPIAENMVPSCTESDIVSMITAANCAEYIPGSKTML